MSRQTEIHHYISGLIIDTDKPTAQYYGKNAYYLQLDRTTDNQCLYKLHPIHSISLWSFCRVWCEKIDGKHVIIFHNPCGLTQETIVKIAKIALDESEKTK